MRQAMFIPALLIACAGIAHAQDFPRKAVRVVAPFAPGGATDLLARLVSQKLSERWGQSVIIDNRTGAGGHIGAELAARSPPDGYTLLVAGAPHAIGVTGAKRSPLLPDAPTVAEAGLPGFDVTSWYGMFAPAATPREIINKVNADIHAALATPDMKERLASSGAEPAPTTPEELGKLVREEIAKWSKVVAESGAKID